MSARTRFFYSVLTGLLAAAASAPAQDAVPQPAVQNSRYQFSGIVNSSDVYVRSGPGEAWYETQKLPQSTPVTVVGIKGDWLKIAPPPGSYCLVTKLYIDRQGDGTVGRVTRSDINVRAGSTLTAVKTTVLAQLNIGDEVKILGEQDEYYKIAPPPGTYFYIHKDFVDPVKAVAMNTAPDAGEGDATPTNSAPVAEPAASSGNAATDQPSTRPADAVAQAPTTQPAPGPTPEELAITDFNKLELDFATASAKPLEDQPAADLEQRYEAIAKNTALPASYQETAGFRLAVLKVRLDAQARLADVKKLEEAAVQRTAVLKTEQDELQKRLDASQVALYAAVGQLEPSSLQFGSATMYRLIDPGTQRTLVYVTGDDAQAVKLMDQFVGVRGEPALDEKLNVKVIPCTVIEAVDPAQVNTKVIAGIVPPSLLGRAVQASAGN